MNVVARRTTPLSAGEAQAAVASALRATFGRDMTRELPWLMALVWIETARGKSVQNFNLGNISASESFPGDAWRPPWFDLEGGTAATERNIALHEAMLQGKAPRAFRAYPSLEFGALDFARVLKASFPEVIAAAGENSATAFRDALAQRYSKDYRNTPPENFAQLASEFGATGSRPVPMSVLAAIGIAGAVGVFAWVMLRAPRVAPRKAAA